MIVDAGGGTVDLSTYSRAGVSEGNRCFQEIAIPQCELLCWDSSNSSDVFCAGQLSGSIFVTGQAQIYLQGDYLMARLPLSMSNFCAFR